MKNFLIGISVVFTGYLNAQNSSFYFWSGFEPAAVLRQYELNGVQDMCCADVYGTDNVSGYDWVTDLDSNGNIGSFRIYYEVGDTLKAKAALVADPVNSANTVLKFNLPAPNVPNGGNPKGRIQASINGNINLKEFYFKVKMYLHPDLAILKSYNGKITWFTLMEFWNNGSFKPFPFRITLNIQKPDSTVNSNLYFGAHGQTKVITSTDTFWLSKWEQIDTSYAVPLGQWLTVETYFLEGDSLHGRYVVTITDTAQNRHTLFNVTQFTHHPDDTLPDGVRNFNPMKLYTKGTLINAMAANNAELSVFWDDFELITDTTVLGLERFSHLSLKNTILYPNPANTQITLSVPGNVKNVVIYDASAKMVKQMMRASKNIAIQELNPGIYFLSFVTQEGKRQVLKFIKR